MRMDAKALLEKLNRADFGYREFSDPLANIEPWPIFESLLADARVVGVKRSRVRREAIAERASDDIAPQPFVTPEAVSFFANYASRELPAAPAAAVAEPVPEPANVRALLGRLGGRG